MIYDLPTSLDVCGVSYVIRSDFRAVLDICIALSDINLDATDKAIALLDILYPDYSEMPPKHYPEAIERGLWFVGCGDESQNKKAPILMNWEQDFKYIVAPINHVVGKEIRAIEYMHWWTFISAYYEIGDCYFAQIVRIRDKKARGKKLDQEDREFYKKNRENIDLKISLSDAENEILKQWT